MLERQSTHAGAFEAHHQRQRAGQIAVVERSLGFVRRADDSDAVALQLAKRACQIGDLDERYMLRSPSSHPADGFGKGDGAPLRCNDGVYTGCIRGTQTGAKVVGILYAVEDQQQRRVGLFKQRVQIAFAARDRRGGMIDVPGGHRGFRFPSSTQVSALCWCYPNGARERSRSRQSIRDKLDVLDRQVLNRFGTEWRGLSRLHGGHIPVSCPILLYRM